MRRGDETGTTKRRVGRARQREIRGTSVVLFNRNLSCDDAMDRYPQAR